MMTFHDALGIIGIVLIVILAIMVMPGR